MKKILIANRGEIALRIMKTVKKMGIATVAVYSKADTHALHVQFADEAVFLGPSPSNQSYLLGDKIIKEAKRLNVDAIHPGYGFLSENADFAQGVIDAGMVFIGPSPESMRIMGSKLAAKSAVKDYNIPMVPGTDTAISDVKDAKSIAKKIGFPILIKASAGGGGKGMRVVENEKEFEDQMDRAVSEAKSSFGDGSVFIEKYINNPRHIEIQILADNFGNTVYLFERECSIQRRHQKVIEEAPSSVLTDKLRKEMGEAAIKVAKSCNYSGAGTVEFLFEKGKFYFLEMNTRLQVEHPVTEFITGIDLVEEQIKVAQNKLLDIVQEDLKINGHAFELRVYAENPENNFLPATGILENYKEPKGDGIRVDGAFKKGMEIPIFYDPMIAKLIVHAENRDAAIKKMIEAINNYTVLGVSTTLLFGKWVFEQKAFVDGDFDTNFITKYFKENSLFEMTKQESELMAKLALKIHLAEKNKLRIVENEF